MNHQHRSHGTRRRSLLAVILAVIAGGSSALSFAPPAQASHQELTWNDDGATFATFGPNEAVTITLGFIEFACDSFFHTADIYVVDAIPAAGGALSDAGGVQNTVFGAAGGLFSDTIAFTQPGGPLGSGTYSVVYDECQDGKFDANVDKVFPNAFAVVIPAIVPPIAAYIQGIKSAAGQQALVWRDTIAAYDLLLNLEKLEIVLKCLTFDVTACVDAFATDVIVNGLGEGIPGISALSPVDKVKAVAKDAANDMFKHWDAIASDPPDPAFEQVTVLEAIPPFVVEGNPLDQAMIRLGRATAIQAAVAKALLHSMERYQGADAVGDGSWALEHARAMARYARLLAAAIERTDETLATLGDALASDSRDFDSVAAFAAGERARILATGLSDLELQTLASLGMSGPELGLALGSIDAFEPAAFSRAGFDAAIAAQITADQATAAELAAMAAALDGLTAALEADPQIRDERPIADAGGPYAASVGSPILLNGTASIDPDGVVVSQTWDIDADGLFDDAAGATASPTATAGDDGLVGVRVIDDAGRDGVAYALLAISNPNHAPNIVTNPSDATPSLSVGATVLFGVTASGEDLDLLSVAWELDGDVVGAGPSFEFTPGADMVGARLLEAVVSDGRPGGTTRGSWTVIVTMADDDGDGWPVDLDCDDADAGVNPGMFEVRGNGTDDDCFAASTDVITDVPPGGGDGTVVVPYLSSGWRYLIVGNYAGTGFEGLAFDDTAWSTGIAPFASDTFGCGITLGQTYWPLGTDVLVRRHIDLPSGSNNVSVRVVVDNDVQVFLNGVDISGGVVAHGGCPGYGSPFLFPVPDALLATGDNVLAIRGQDFGGFSYLDVEVLADIPGFSVPPGTTGLEATATASAEVTRNFTWTIDKTATPSAWDLFEGDTGTSEYRVTLDRTEIEGVGAVTGEVCTTNIGPAATDGLAVSATIHAGTPAAAVAVATVLVDVTADPVLDPGETGCYAYDAALPPGTAHWGERYTTISHVTITNHALATGAFGPQTQASDTMTEGGPSASSSATVTDPDDPGGTATHDGDAVRTYTRTFGCGDAGVQNASAAIDETGAADAAPVRVACHSLAVTSSVAAIAERSYSWNIDKTANAEDLVLALNQAFPITYGVTLTATAAERGLAAGSVSIHNSAPAAAVVTAVDEVMAGLGAASVDCGAPLPFTILAGGTLTCSFQSAVPSAADTTGVATVARQRLDLEPSGSWQGAGIGLITTTAAIDFSAGGTVEIDDCIDVDDSLQGSLGSVCATGAPATLTYVLDIGPYTTTGLRSVVNTATLTARSTGATMRDAHTVFVDVPAGGCTLTIGYWKTHAGAGPQHDMVSPLLPLWLGTPGGATAVRVTTPAQAIDLLAMADSAANGVNRLAAQLLGLKLNVGAGADASAVGATVVPADDFLTTHSAASWKRLSKADKARVTAWATTLDWFNRGLVGPGHCVE